MMAAVYCCTDG